MSKMKKEHLIKDNFETVSLRITSPLDVLQTSNENQYRTVKRWQKLNGPSICCDLFEKSLQFGTMIVMLLKFINQRNHSFMNRVISIACKWNHDLVSQLPFIQTVNNLKHGE